MGKLERAEILRAICRQRYGVTLSCSVRTGTNPVLLARRWSMGLIEFGIKSLKAPRLSQLLKRRPNESMRGPNNAGGRWVVADLAGVWIGNSVSCETASTSEVQRSFH